LALLNWVAWSRVRGETSRSESLKRFARCFDSRPASSDRDGQSTVGNSGLSLPDRRYGTDSAEVQ
jgi:hypothetical protein